MASVSAEGPALREYLRACEEAQCEPVPEFAAAASSAVPQRCAFGRQATALTLPQFVAICATLRVHSVAAELHLDGVALGRLGAVELYPVLTANAALTSLAVVDAALGDEGAVLLCSALHRNSALRRLDLRRNQIGPLGGQAVAQMVQVNRGLTALDLEGNGMTDESCAALAKALHGNSSLRSLTLRNTGIGDRGAGALAGALRANPFLAALDVAGNRLGDEGAQSLAEALLVNGSLTALHLQANRCTAQCCPALAAALAQSTTLTELSVGQGLLDERGIVCLVEALLSNATLRKLDLQGSVVGVQAARAIGRLLQCNVGLRQLRLDLAPVLGRREAAVTVAQGLRQNTSLTELSLGEPGVDPDVWELISGLLQANQKRHSSGLSPQRAVVQIPPASLGWEVRSLIGSHHLVEAVDVVSAQWSSAVEEYRAIRASPEPRRLPGASSPLFLAQRPEEPEAGALQGAVQELSARLQRQEERLRLMQSNATEKWGAVESRLMQLEFEQRRRDVPRVPNAATLRPPLEEAEAMKAALRDAQSETLHFKKEIRSSVAELADRFGALAQQQVGWEAGLEAVHRSLAEQMDDLRTAQKVEVELAIQGLDGPANGGPTDLRAALEATEARCAAGVQGLARQVEALAAAVDRQRSGSEQLQELSEAMKALQAGMVAATQRRDQEAQRLSRELQRHSNATAAAERLNNDMATSLARLEERVQSLQQERDVLAAEMASRSARHTAATDLLTEEQQALRTAVRSSEATVERFKADNAACLTALEQQFLSECASNASKDAAWRAAFEQRVSDIQATVQAELQAQAQALQLLQDRLARTPDLSPAVRPAAQEAALRRGPGPTPAGLAPAPLEDELLELHMAAAEQRSTAVQQQEQLNSLQTLLTTMDVRNKALDAEFGEIRQDSLRTMTQVDALEHTAGALTNKVVALEEIVTGLAYKADTFQRQQAVEGAALDELAVEVAALRERPAGQGVPGPAAAAVVDGRGRPEADDPTVAVVRRPDRDTTEVKRQQSAMGMRLETAEQTLLAMKQHQNCQEGKVNDLERQVIALKDIVVKSYSRVSDALLREKADRQEPHRTNFQNLALELNDIRDQLKLLRRLDRRLADTPASEIGAEILCAQQGGAGKSLRLPSPCKFDASPPVDGELAAVRQHLEQLSSAVRGLEDRGTPQPTADPGLVKGSLERLRDAQLHQETRIHQLSGELQRTIEVTNHLNHRLTELRSFHLALEDVEPLRLCQRVHQLTHRVDILEEILRQDQKASLAALEAILKEKEPGPAPDISVAVVPTLGSASLLWNMSLESPSKLRLEVPAAVPPCSVTAHLSIESSPPGPRAPQRLRTRPRGPIQPPAPDVTAAPQNPPSRENDTGRPPACRPIPRPPSPAPSAGSLPSTNLSAAVPSSLLSGAPLRGPVGPPAAFLPGAVSGFAADASLPRGRSGLPGPRPG